MLTTVAIKNLKPKGKLYRVTDESGLCLEVTPTGQKLWRWRYRYLGKSQMISLGSFPAVSLLQARKGRDDARSLLTSGKHPAREKKSRKLRAMYENNNTFERIAREWLGKRHSLLNKKYADQCLTRMEQHIFPVIGSLPVTEISTPDVVRAVEKLADRGTVETAKRMKQLISQTFRYAVQKGICLYNPAADLRDVLPATTEKHHACIPLSELPTLLIAMKDFQGSELTRSAMQLLALTFVRTNELIGARWSEIDWDRREWLIPTERMKMKRPHTVPLSSQALSILQNLHEITGHHEYIFFSPCSKSKHLSNGAVLMALRRMGYERRMTGHGFRTLASTILNENGYKPDWIEKQLAHEDSDKIRSAYNRAEYLLERRKMMQDYADLLDQIRNKIASDVFVLDQIRVVNRREHQAA